MNPKFVWPTIVLASLGLVVAGIMAIAGVSPETIVTITTLTVVPVLSALVVGQIAEQKGTMTQVAQQTNGNTSRLIDIIERQGQALAAMSPPSDVRTPDVQSG